MQHNCRSTLLTQILTCLKLKEFFLFNLLLIETLYLFGILLSCVSAGSEVQDFQYTYCVDQLCVVFAAQIISVVF